jgi:Fic family protein
MGFHWLNISVCHKRPMRPLPSIDDAGHYRQSGVGVMQGQAVIHMAPPAQRVAGLMQDLLHWLKHSKEHPLIRSCVFHYEFEFIHPFADGNGRMGRLWQTLILSQWKPIFTDLPVEIICTQFFFSGCLKIIR